MNGEETHRLQEMRRQILLGIGDLNEWQESIGKMRKELLEMDMKIQDRLNNNDGENEGK